MDYDNQNKYTPVEQFGHAIVDTSQETRDMLRRRAEEEEKTKLFIADQAAQNNSTSQPK